MSRALRSHREKALDDERNIDAVANVGRVVARRTHEILELDVFQERERDAPECGAIPAEGQAQGREGPPGDVRCGEVASQEKGEHQKGCHGLFHVTTSRRGSRDTMAATTRTVHMASRTSRNSATMCQRGSRAALSSNTRKAQCTGIIFSTVATTSL